MIGAASFYFRYSAWTVREEAERLRGRRGRFPFWEENRLTMGEREGEGKSD